MANINNNKGLKQETSKSNKFIRVVADNIGWIIVAIGVLFWFIESAVHAFLFGKGHFVQQLMHPDINEIWMRLLILILFVVFGLYVQRSLKKSDDNKAEQSWPLPIDFKRYLVWAIVFWTLVIVASLVQSFYRQRNTAR